MPEMLRMQEKQVTNMVEIKGITKKHLKEEKEINEGKNMFQNSFNIFYDKELKGWDWGHIMCYGRRIFAGIAYAAGRKAERKDFIDYYQEQIKNNITKQVIITQKDINRWKAHKIP